MSSAIQQVTEVDDKYKHTLQYHNIWLVSQGLGLACETSIWHGEVRKHIPSH